MTTTRRVPVIAAGAALLLIVAWYFLLWAPQTRSLKSAHKDYGAAQQKISNLQGQQAQLQAELKDIPADTAKLAQLQAALPDNPQLDQALRLLHDAAVQSGVLLISAGPSTPAGAASSAGQSSSTAGAGGPAITISMAVQGTFNQIKTFLSALNTSPRTFVVDKVSISGGGGGGPAAATLSARIFYAGQATP